MRPGTSQGPTPSKNLFGNAPAQGRAQTAGGSGGAQPSVRFVGVGGNRDAAADFGAIGSSHNINSNNMNNVNLTFTSLPSGMGGFGGCDYDPGDGSRTPLTAQMEVTAVHVKNCEAAVATLTERLSELNTNAIRCKQLEAELAPREAERGNVVNSFQRLVETGTRIKKAAKKKKEVDDETGSHDDTDSHADSKSEATAPGGAGKPGAPGGAAGAAGASGTRRFGLNLLAAKDDMTREEIADRDAVRGLANRIRNTLTPVLSEVFFSPPTLREAARAQLLADEAAAAAAREANPRAGSGAGKRGAGKGGAGNNNVAGGMAASVSASSGAATVAQLSGGGGLERLDPQLYLMPGIDPSFFTDVLNLRQMRLTAEKALSKTQEQLAQAQSVVTMRRNDGSNKTALRRAEKALVQAQGALRELHRQKEEREIRRRLELAAAADAKEAQQAAANAGGVPGARGGRAVKPPAPVKPATPTPGKR